MRGVAVVTLLACAALLAPGEVSAVPRGSTVEPEPLTPEEQEARRLQTAAEMAAWLPRLVGRFSIQGIIGGGTRPMPIKGAADCIAVGKGPGVQCVLNATWGAKGDSFLGPAVILYGMDPAAGMIRYLQLNADGLVRSLAGTGDGPAVLSGDTLSWWCVTDGVPHPCTNLRGNVFTMRLRAPPDSKFVQMTFDFDGRIIFNLDMDRVPRDQENKPSKAAPAQRQRGSK